jgi:hypothetical protein
MGLFLGGWNQVLRFARKAGKIIDSLLFKVSCTLFAAARESVSCKTSHSTLYRRCYDAVHEPLPCRVLKRSYVDTLMKRPTSHYAMAQLCVRVATYSVACALLSMFGEFLTMCLAGHQTEVADCAKYYTRVCG